MVKSLICAKTWPLSNAKLRGHQSLWYCVPEKAAGGDGDRCRSCSPSQSHAVAYASASALSLSACHPVGQARTAHLKRWLGIAFRPFLLQVCVAGSPSTPSPHIDFHHRALLSTPHLGKNAFPLPSDTGSGSGSDSDDLLREKHSRAQNTQHWCDRGMSVEIRRRNCRRCCLICIGSTLIVLSAAWSGPSVQCGRTWFGSDPPRIIDPVPHLRHIREPR